MQFHPLAWFHAIAHRPCSVRSVFTCAAALMGLVLGFGCQSTPSAGRAGPWDLAELTKAPIVMWGASNGLVQEVFYVGEPLLGQPTRVFAYLGRPTNSMAGS